LFLLLAVAVSAIKPILLTRTVAWVLIPLAIALGDVLARRTSVIAFGVVAVLALATTLHVSRAGTLVEDWRGFLGRLPRLGPPALVVLAPATSPAALARYAPGAEPVRLDDGLPPVPETTVIPRIFGTKTIPLAEFRAAVAAGRPVWLIYRRPEYDWILKATAGLPPPRLAVQEGEGSNPAMRALLW
jgi:hypothetical protein